MMGLGPFVMRRGDGAPGGCATARECVSGTFDIAGRWDAALFGEAQSRIVVSLSSGDLPRFEALASEQSVPWVVLGLVGGTALSLPPLMDVSLDAVKAAWRGGLEEALA